MIGRLFFPADMPDWLRLLQTFGIFSAGYLARPLGGIVIAHFGDLLGRKRMFTLSIFLMAAPTLAIGLLPTYASIGIAAPLLLLLMRILQGVAIGGEVPGAWVFVAEHVPAQRFGFGIGTLTAGLTTGILIGSLMAGAINTIYSPADVDALRLAHPVHRRRRVRLRLGLPAALPRGDAGVPGDEGAPRARARGAAQDGAPRSPRARRCSRSRSPGC